MSSKLTKIILKKPSEKLILTHFLSHLIDTNSDTDNLDQVATSFEKIMGLEKPFGII